MLVHSREHSAETSQWQMSLADLVSLHSCSHPAGSGNGQGKCYGSSREGEE